ncbi:DUF2931 family protein [Pedobacter sp.]|uniref:DUF2931 family protein n=1 Tax=Pedobacter sp. TaxID=1411316 RepID=UPI003BAC5B6E
MKLNLINKIYIAIAIGLSIGIAIKFFSFKSWDRYYYVTSICAPSTQPIAIRNAHFILADGETDFITHTDVDDFNTNWGQDDFISSDFEKQRLPLKLVLQYASYRDKKFYNDTINLNENEIRSIFKSAIRNKQAIGFSKYGGVSGKGLSFLIGIANDGNLAVWLQGIYLDKFLVKQKLKAKQPQGDDTYYGAQLTKEAYLKQRFERLSDSLKNKLDKGFEARANYIDTPTRYIEKNTELWEYQKKNKYIE